MQGEQLDDTPPRPRPLKTPDITPAQLITLAGTVLAIVAALGFPISHELEDSIIRMVTVLAPTIVGADALIRFGRSKHLGGKATRQ